MSLARLRPAASCCIQPRRSCWAQHRTFVSPSPPLNARRLDFIAYPHGLNRPHADLNHIVAAWSTQHLADPHYGVRSLFRIRIYTPPIVNDAGWPHAGAELIAGVTRLHRRIDLRFWRIADYERQWREGIARLVNGAESSALMSAFSGPGDASHSMWALWREATSVYIQPLCVLAAPLDDPFDPRAPYEHVGARVPVTENDLPMDEWRVELDQLMAFGLRIRWPLSQ